MKKIKVREFLKLRSCYTPARIREIAGDKTEWSALDILALDIPPEDRLWAVLREELIDAPILHEFACLCAEALLQKLQKPDPRSVACIASKRAWVKGEITVDELYIHRSPACRAFWESWDSVNNRRTADFAAASSALAAGSEEAALAATQSANEAPAEDALWQVETLKKLLLENTV